jgi:hypothetical protein
MSEQIILGSAYVPPIAWMHIFMANEHAVIDLAEHYAKQTYKNRCTILSANGPLHLSIPVKKPQYLHKAKVLEIKVENEFTWQKQHWEAICSAYNGSAYFEYYKHLLEPIYHHTYTHLHQLNHDLLMVLLKILKSTRMPDYSHAYLNVGVDYRNLIHPKKPTVYSCKKYPQVFAYKYGFVPNLSVLDLICNCGPQSLSYLL